MGGCRWRGCCPACAELVSKREESLKGRSHANQASSTERPPGPEKGQGCDAAFTRFLHTDMCVSYHPVVTRHSDVRRVLSIF